MRDTNDLIRDMIAPFAPHLPKTPPTMNTREVFPDISSQSAPSAPLLPAPPATFDARAAEIIEDAKCDAWDEVHGKFQRKYDEMHASVESDVENALTEVEALRGAYGPKTLGQIESVRYYLKEAEKGLDALRRFVEE